MPGIPFNTAVSAPTIYIFCSCNTQHCAVVAPPLSNLSPVQVARESYLQWLADQEKSRRSGSGRPAPPAATVTSGQMSPRAATCSSGPGHVSPRHGGSSSPRPRVGAGAGSPQAGCSYSQDQGRDSPKPGSSRSCGSGAGAGAASLHPGHSTGLDHGLGPGFHLRETASFLNGLPPDLFGEYISSSNREREMYLVLLQVWMTEEKMPSSCRCWPLVSRSTWTASSRGRRRLARPASRRTRRSEPVTVNSDS